MAGAATGAVAASGAGGGSEAQSESSSSVLGANDGRSGLLALDGSGWVSCSVARPEASPVAFGCSGPTWAASVETCGGSLTAPGCDSLSLLAFKLPLLLLDERFLGR
jgi:hypothetical protein